MKTIVIGLLMLMSVNANAWTGEITERHIIGDTYQLIYAKYKFIPKPAKYTQHCVRKLIKFAEEKGYTEPTDIQYARNVITGVSKCVTLVKKEETE